MVVVNQSALQVARNLLDFIYAIDTMPYQLIERAGKFAVKTKTTGKTHGFTTEKKAKAQMRLLEALAKGEYRRR